MRKSPKTWLCINKHMQEIQNQLLEVYAFDSQCIRFTSAYKENKKHLGIFSAYICNNLYVHVYCMFKNTIIDAKNFKLTPKSDGICLEFSLRKGMAWGCAKATSVLSSSGEGYVAIQLHLVVER